MKKSKCRRKIEPPEDEEEECGQGTTLPIVGKQRKNSGMSIVPYVLYLRAINV